MPECPWEAIFPEDEVPTALKTKAGQIQSMPVGTPGFTEAFDGHDHEGEAVHLDATKVLTGEEVLDLTPETEANKIYFTKGPGYSAAG